MSAQVIESSREHSGTSVSGMTISAIQGLVMRRWKAIALAASLTLTASVGAFVSQTKVYKATCTLRVEPEAQRPLGRAVELPTERNGYWESREYGATQRRLIKSRSLAESVVREMNLHRDARFLQNLPPGATPKPLVSGTDTVEKAALTLLSRVEVEPIRDTRLVDVSLEDADPARAQRVLEILAKKFIGEQLGASVEAIDEASTWLNDELKDLKKELELNELSLHHYKKENQLLSASLQDQTNMLRSEMEHLNTALTVARTQRESIAARASILQKVSEDDPSVLPVSELLKSEALADLTAEYTSAKKEVEKLHRLGKGEGHPQVLQAEASLGIARKALVTAAENVKSAAQQDLVSIDREIAGLRGLFEAAEKRAFDLNLKEIEYKRIARAKDNTERLYGLVLERAKESELTSRMRFANISLIDPPLIPKKPVKPRAFLFFGLGGAAGLAAGIILAFARERMDQRIRSRSDIDLRLGIPCLGTIPEFIQEGQAREGESIPAPAPNRRQRRKAGKGDAGGQLKFVDSNPNSAAAEAIRALRTNLLFLSPDKPLRRLLVTSASPSEGKSTITSSIAISLANSGKTTLLIDADLRRPTIGPGFLEHPSSKGLSTAILRPGSLEEGGIQSTDIENLYVLPAGALPPNPAELLHSANFRTLIERAAEKFHYVLIDSPPLMPVTDAAIISNIADATLLVIREGHTRADHALHALRCLNDARANIAGVVLNMSKGMSGAYGYGYSYGYQPGGKLLSDAS